MSLVKLGAIVKHVIIMVIAQQIGNIGETIFTSANNVVIWLQKLEELDIGV